MGDIRLALALHVRTRGQRQQRAHGRAASADGSSAPSGPPGSDYSLGDGGSVPVCSATQAGERFRCRWWQWRYGVNTKSSRQSVEMRQVFAEGLIARSGTVSGFLQACEGPPRRSAGTCAGRSADHRDPR
jgi:hypothetical protein